MRIVFMGTPQFAIPSLEMLIKSKHEVVAVVCQPDKKQGRKMVLTIPPTKEFAILHGIPVLQPSSAKNEGFVKDLIDLMPDLYVTCAYGKILPESVLKIPTKGCINVHASLLPDFRGAAPIQWALIKGVKRTGITTMLTDIGMDTGPILLKEFVEIDNRINAGELYEILMNLGPKVLLATLQLLETNKLNPIDQIERESSYAPMLKKTDGNILWTKSSTDIHNLVRGTSPRPGAFSMLKGRIIKVCLTEVCDLTFEINRKFINGEIVELSKGGMVVSCGNGFIKIIKVQPSSGKEMDSNSFANGHKIVCGDRFETILSVI